jgi:REP element-mobilizing transposase RayT
MRRKGTHGGARDGAGRKATVRRADPRHRTRRAVSPRHPVHVVLRVVREVGSLRRPHAYRAVRGALFRVMARGDYRVVHVSIQRTHLHLLIEADDARALARGMQSFAITAARRLNRALGRRRGTVFPYRYHATAIGNPTQARNAIAYVANNWRHHGADRYSRLRLDPYSSADAFGGWERPVRAPRPADALPVARPSTWLLAHGWRRAGPIDWAEVPGNDPEP